METVVLGDASRKGLFKNDPYIRHERARSILLLPIIKRSKLIGMLFLENNLIDNAFSREALPVLRVIAAQAAIALENARLYDELSDLNRDLERRVETRTQELRQANRRLTNEIDYRRKAQRDLERVQGQLLETARRAGMAEMATGVLHNVGNVLNSVNVSTNLVTSRVDSFSIGDLEQMLQVLESQDDLGRFVSEDPRGKHFLPFLRELQQDLVQQKGSIREELSSLTEGIHHIIDLVRSQQSYAGRAGVQDAAFHGCSSSSPSDGCAAYTCLSAMSTSS